MIWSDRFIWLHVPKSAGWETAAAIRSLGAFQTSEHDHWHDTIAERREREPGFQVAGRPIVANIRRLPSWLLSRVHYEAARSNIVPTRRMLVNGEFYRADGSIRNADWIIERYDRPHVDRWIRAERLVDDFSTAFRDLVDLPGDLSARFGGLNQAATPYVRDIGFWFTARDFARLYAANPRWAALEERLYGSLA